MSSSPPIKRKRGRPRKDETADVDAAVKPTKKKAPTVGVKKKVSTIKEAEECPLESSSPPRRTGRQRARQTPQIPTTSIASYGRQISINVTSDEAQADASDEPQYDLVTSPMTNLRQITTPIVVSLPISDTQEHRHISSQQPTLEEQLTEYHPEVNQIIPSAMVSSLGVLQGAAYLPDEHEPISSRDCLERCIACVTQAGPCEECINRFNKTNKTSFDNYYKNRESDTVAYSLPDTAEYVNNQINDTPIDPKKFKSIRYEPKTDNSSNHHASEPEPLPFEPIGSDLVTETIVSDSVAETHRLREEVERLSRMLAEVNDRSSLPRSGPQSGPQSGPPAGDQKPNECMWHLAGFETGVVGLPLSYDESSQTFNCIGCFCSLECAYAYRLEHRSAEAAPIRLLHIAHKMRERAEQVPEASELTPAPPRQALIRFGGTMTLETFLNSSHPWYAIRHPPFNCISETIERIDGETASTMYRSMSAAPAAPSGELVRKREKPHPNAQNQWHTSIQRSRLRRKE